MIFLMNNRIWRIIFVNPNSVKLKRSDGSLTVGVTDGKDGCVYLSNALQGAFFCKVLCHELCHVASFSYGLHIDVQTEEIIADFLSTYGREIFYIADDLLGRFAKAA